MNNRDLYPRATVAERRARWGTPENRFNCQPPREMPGMSIATVGKGFYWITWRLPKLGTDEPFVGVLADGLAATRDKAVIAAAEALGVDPREALLRERSAWAASNEYRKRRVVKRPAKASRAQADLGSLYRNSFWGSSFEPCRITKITRKRIFVADPDYHWNKRHQFSVDREALERDGCAESKSRSRYYDTFYTEEGKRRWEEERAAAPRVNGADPDLDLLGLEPGCTRADVLSAFRRLSKIHHPDQGGAAAAFRELVAAKDRLLAQFRAAP